MQGTRPSPPGSGPWRSADPPSDFTPFPPEAMDGSVTDRFFAVADASPDAEALRSPAGTWTYREAAEVVRRTASGLITRLGGDGPEPVGILADHDGPLVLMILAVAAAGHVVVILDPTAPHEQTDHVVDESGLALVLIDRPRPDADALIARREGVDLVTPDELDADRRELPARGPADPVMLAFTSGTSGSSKGATVTHGVLLSVVRGATDALGVTSVDRMPMLFPLSLAVAAYPLFIPLLNGGTLCTLDVRGVGLAPVPGFLADERITLAYMAPTVVRFLVDSIGDHTFPDLRMIALGGELVDADVVRLTHDLFAPTFLANGFGTTETGVITLHVIDPEAPIAGPVPAGYPVPGVELAILDDAGNPAEPGAAGEVAVMSPYVFSGYWGHAALSDVVLDPDPGGREGWHRYRTGDLGRLDEHGALTVLGRTDTKVKVRGRFVVLGDVEAELHDLEGVADAAVVATVDDGVTGLAAVVSVSAADHLDGPALRTVLLERHQAYRVPSRWLVVEELPRLPNGKVDRRAVADLAATSSVIPPVAKAPIPAASAETAPAGSTPMVRVVRDLWERLLPVGVVDLDTDFAALGGDSLLAAQMLVYLEAETGITIPMGDLVHARTVREVAAAAEARREDGADGVSTVAEVQRGAGDRPRLWFVHDLQGSAYRVRHVAAALGGDQPVWSFESPLLRGEPNRSSHLDTFAARYVRDLVEVQPEGPYWLAGYSFGGICAYEMARQLRRDGHEVAFVGIIDVGPGYRGPGWGDDRSPFRPWFGVAKPPPEGASPAEVVRHYRAMAKRSPAGTARHLSVRTGLFRAVDPARFALDLRRRGRVRPEWRLWYAWEEHWKLASRRWDRTSSYAGAVDLFWADGTASSDASLGWGPLVDEVRVHRFTGDHIGALEPRGAAALARVVRGALDAQVAVRSDDP